MYFSAEYVTIQVEKAVVITETENILSKDISLTEKKAAFDAACKRLLANKSILAWIMKDCVEEYRNCSIEDIAEKYIEGNPSISQTAVHPDETNSNVRGIGNEDTTLTEGTVTYDIRFMALVPESDGKIELIINIEAQNKYNPGYPLLKRGVYYGSRMISAQYGTEFDASHYEKIKKVYSIWICMNPPQKNKNCITRYSIKEEHVVGEAKAPKQYYDLMTVIMIYLGDDRSSQRVLKLLEVLLSETAAADEKKQILQEDFEIKMTHNLESEVSGMCNLSDGIEERATARGIARGMAQGMERGTIQSILSLMHSLKLTVQQAMEALEIPQSEQGKYEAMIKQMNAK